MKRASALVAAVAFLAPLAWIALDSNVAVAQQDGGGKKRPEHPAPQAPGGGEKPADGGKDGKDKEARKKEREERIANFKKAVASAKTTLAAAMATAEKDTSGKAFAAEYKLGKDNVLTIDVKVVAGEKFQLVTVDSETGKSSPAKDLEGPGGGAGGGH